MRINVFDSLLWYPSVVGQGRKLEWNLVINKGRVLNGGQFKGYVDKFNIERKARTSEDLMKNQNQWHFSK